MKAKTTEQRDRIPQPRRNAVSHAVKTHIQTNRNHYVAAAIVSGALAIPQQAPAQESMTLEEIIVTATKREESLQNVPIAVTAFDATTLTELGMKSFEDFAMMVPNLSFKSWGYPGGATMYMRGAADGGNGNPSGSAPSVAVYLDEQPVSFIGGNLDVHIYDIERMEALAGPQGTLYGASSQTGNVRYITNKPDPEAFAGGFDLEGIGTTDGDPGYSAEGFVNFPLGEKSAIRLVGWHLEEGGWIDNVPSSAAFASGRRRLDDQPGDLTYQDTPGQYSYPIYGSGATVVKTPDAFAEEDFNELTKTGLRAALGVDLNDNWTGTVGVIWQETETDGVWEHSPNQVGEGNVQRYSEDSWDDDWTQFSLTVEGKFANNSLVYAGSFMDRDTDYSTGYNAYGEYNSYVNYYACDYTGTATDCTSLEEQFVAPFKWERTSQELRLLSLGDSRLHYTVGLFYETIDFDYELLYVQVGMSPSLWVDGIEDLFFRTDQVREDSQFAVFGEVTFDFTDSVSGTLGMRYFDEESTVRGLVGWGGNIYVPAPGKDTSVDAKVSNDDIILKANVTWNVSDDALVYATWSEGYRPGGLNRDPALIVTAGSQSWIPDIMTNYEIGWKSTLANGRVRFNGAAYFMEWEDVQYTIYEFSLSTCCGNVYNLATAEITGVEFELTALLSDSFTLSFAGAYNDAETTADFVLPSGRLSVPSGTPLPNVPEFKGSVSARYEFDLTSNLPGYAQLVWSYTGSSTSEITPRDVWPQDSYSIGNFRAGVNKGSWGVDLFVDNVTDERADIYVSPRNYELTTVTNRPRNYGVRYWTRFE